jgi:hypothetical protein
VSRVLSVVRHSRLTVGQASPAVVTTAPTPTLNQTADIAPVRPRGVRTIRRHNRIYFGKPATTQLVSEDFYAALNARMDGAYAAVTFEASARISGDSSVASSVTSLSSSFTTYQGTANGRLTSLEGTTGTLGTRMTTAESAITTEATTRATADSANASSISSLSSSFTSYQTSNNSAVSAAATAASRIRVFRQSTTPTAGGIGDVWFNTSNSNKPYAWDGTSWVLVDDQQIAAVATVAGRVRVFRQASAPSAGGVGDVWYNTGDSNRPYVWDGSSWVISDDTRIATAQAAITSEASTRATADSAMASQITSLTANLTTTQAQLADTGPIEAVVTWNFNNTADGWTTNGAVTTATVQASALRLSSTGDMIIYSPTISIDGSKEFLVQARVTRVAGAGWDGTVLHFTAGHGESASYYKNLANPGLTAGQSAILTWDMSALTVGGADWISNTITKIRLDLGSTSADVFDVDWVAIGHRGPGNYNVSIAAANAAITTEQTARVNGDSANATSITNLTTSFNTYKTSNDAALGTTNSNLGALTTRVTSAESAITTEASTRSSADSTNATAISTLNSSFTSYQTTANGRLGALESTTGSLGTRMTAAETNITNEASTRASADTAEASTRSALGASVQTQITNLGSGTAQQVFKQGSAPTVDQVCPPGKNRLNQSSFVDGVFNYWKITTTYTGSSDRGLFATTDTWTPPGARNVFVHLAGTPASGTYMGLYNDGLDGSPRYAVTAGQKYEFSAYLANHRLQGVTARIVWFNATPTYLGTSSSTTVTTQGGGSGNKLSTFERVFVIATAPAGATQCYLVVDGTANGTADPYIMLVKPFFGLAEPDQTVPSPWVDANTGAIWLNTSDNYRMSVWNGLAWELRDDQRIAVNAAAITSEASTRATADSANASAITSLTTTVNGNTASITSQQTSINGLSALKTLTVNAGGAIAGYSIYAGGGSSTFRIQAENFEVIGSGGSGAAPFRVSGGVTYINEARIANGAVSEVTAGMAAGYVDLAVTVEAGAKLVFILSTLGGNLQPAMELYDLTGGASVVNIAPSSYSFSLWVSTGPDSGYYATQYIYQPTTYQWVLTPSYTGYRAFRLRNNTGNLTSGYATVIMTIMQLKK